MQSRWIRQKQILTVPQDHTWWVSHAQLPTVRPVSDRLWQVYVAGRDTRNMGSVVRIELDPLNDMEILSISQERLIDFGSRGAFDSNGIGVSCAVPQGEETLFISAGLKVREAPPYEIAIGLLTSADGGSTLKRVQPDPVFCAGPENPGGCGTAQMLRVGSTWHIWFASWRYWSYPKGTDPEPRYDIRHAISEDGRTWRQSADAAIPLAGPHEGGVTRPWVQPAAQGYEMWYCTRGRFDASDPTLRNYDIGYAVSDDAMTWTRRDASHGFANPPQPGDWDYEMQCYASVIRAHGRSYMFYCGNGYGRNGFGYAIREEG